MNRWFTTGRAHLILWGFLTQLQTMLITLPFYSKNAGEVTLLLYNGGSFSVPVSEIAFDFHINKSTIYLALPGACSPA